MKTIFAISLLLTTLLFFSAENVKAAQPVGFLDRADSEVVAGWAKDDDYNGPIPVHIYVDGQIAQGVTADGYRSDVGSHGFHWSHPSFGPGNHRVNAYAIGVDSTGQPDNNNPELSASPKTITAQEEYPLTSSDGQVTVVVNAKFGGSITKILDNINWPGKNIIVDSHGGALFQSAFWHADWHNVPVDCPDRGDMHQINPTQGGYYADVIAGTNYGNPIGIQGNDARHLDVNEFIRYEDSGKTVHFKSKFIRHDYCKDPKALIENKSLWDTDFYIEQWVYFNPSYSRTLAIRSIISNVGGSPITISVRALTAPFLQDLTRVAYWKNGQKVIEAPSSDLPFDPDQAYAAFLFQGSDAGMGVVAAPTLTGDQIPGRGQKFSFGMQNPAANITTFNIGYGVPTFTSFGKVNGLYNQTAHLWTFDPGGTFEWYAYYPIGTLDMIKQNSEAILADWSNFGMTPPTLKSCNARCSDNNQCQSGFCKMTSPLPLDWSCRNPSCSDQTDCTCPPPSISGDLNHDGHVDILDLRQLLGSFTNIFNYNLVVGSFGKTQ